MLQKIVECFKENPTWTAAHVAAELEIIECFDNQEFMEEMVKHLSQEELTPLHLACKVISCIHLFCKVSFSV